MVQRKYIPIISIASAIWFCLLGQSVVGQQSFDASTSRVKHACMTPHKLTRQVETKAHVVANAGRFLPRAVANQPNSPTSDSDNQAAVRPSKVALIPSSRLGVPSFERDDPIDDKKSTEEKDEPLQQLLPGLNTRSDVNGNSTAAKNSSLGSARGEHHENLMLHHKQVDFVSQKELVCASPRLSRLPEYVVSESKSQPVSDSEPDRKSMLQPLVPRARKLPKRHEVDLESAATMPEPVTNEVEHIVTTVQLTDGDEAFAYSSINTRQAEAEEAADSFGEPVRLQQHPGPTAESQGFHAEPATTLNFSDTPAAPAASFAGNNQYPLQASGPAANSGLLIHPPMLQPYNANQFTFVVENRTGSTVRDVAIEISVSTNSKIIAALPVNSVNSDSQAIFKFDEIAAGDRVQLHVNAISLDGAAVEFAANVVTRSTYDFSIRGSTEGRLASVSHRLSDDLGPQANDSTEQEAEEPLPGGPRFVRNPYFQKNRQPAQPAGNPTYRH